MYKAKLMMCIVTLLSVIFGIGGSIIISVSFKNMLESEKDNLIISFRNVVNTLEVVNNENSEITPFGIADVLMQFGPMEYNQKYALRFSDGVQYYLNNSDYPFDSSLKKSARYEHFATKIINNSENSYYFQITGKLLVKDKTYFLDGIYDISSIYKQRAYVNRIYMQLFAVIIFIGAVISFIMASVLTRPLEKLSRATKKITEGDLSFRADIKSDDEIGELAENFNTMTDKLSDNIAQLKDAMERQEEFMASFTHEMKTPMTSIIGYADLLRSRQLTKDETNDALNYIFSEGKRLENLSRKLLELIVTENESIAFSKCSIKDTVKGAVNVLKKQLTDNNVSVKLNLEDGLCYCEPVLIETLIVNLIDNAIKALADTNNKTITISTKKEEDGFAVYIEDNGRGIPESELEKICDAFYRVDKSRSRRQGGVGLGLAICSRIVKLHNGTITFKSNLGEGTCAEIKIPGCGRI